MHIYLSMSEVNLEIIMDYMYVNLKKSDIFNLNEDLKYRTCLIWVGVCNYGIEERINKTKSFISFKVYVMAFY